MFPGLSTKLSKEILASSTTVQVSKDLVLMTGNTTLATIKPPANGGFPSVIFVVPTDAGIATTTSGNIAVDVTMPQNRVTVLVYDPVTAKWYPGAIS